MTKLLDEKTQVKRIKRGDVFYIEGKNCPLIVESAIDEKVHHHSRQLVVARYVDITDGIITYNGEETLFHFFLQPALEKSCSSGADFHVSYVEIIGHMEFPSTEEIPLAA